MDTKSDIVALIGRIERLPTYSGDDLGMKHREEGTAPGSGTFEDRVFLVHEKWRAAIVQALNASVAQSIVPPFDVGFIAGIILAGILDDWENGAYSNDTRESAKRLSSELANRIYAFKASSVSSKHERPPQAWLEAKAEVDSGWPDKTPPTSVSSTHRCTWPDCDQPSGHDICYRHCVDNAAHPAHSSVSSKQCGEGE